MGPAAARTARRADAERNTAQILDAAVACLSRSPSATTAEIAQAAGLGRVTVYGHFPSRAALIDAALVRLLERGEAALGRVELGGDPRRALADLIGASWQLTADAGAVLEAARTVLPADRIRDLHEAPARRVRDLVRRGRDEGVFRDDLPLDWLVGVLHHVLKGAAADVAGGRLDPADASRLIVATVLAAYRPPDPPTGFPPS